MEYLLGIVGIFVIAIIIVFATMMKGAGEVKAIGAALAQEKQRLEKLNYDELEKLVAKEPKAEIDYNGMKFIRKLMHGVADHGDYRDMQVKVTLQGIKNVNLEQTAQFMKQKQV